MRCDVSVETCIPDPGKHTDIIIMLPGQFRLLTLSTLLYLVKLILNPLALCWHRFLTTRQGIK